MIIFSCIMIQKMYTVTKPQGHVRARRIMGKPVLMTMNVTTIIAQVASAKNHPEENPAARTAIVQGDAEFATLVQINVSRVTSLMALSALLIASASSSAVIKSKAYVRELRVRNSQSALATRNAMTGSFVARPCGMMSSNAVQMTALLAHSAPGHRNAVIPFDAKAEYVNSEKNAQLKA